MARPKYVCPQCATTAKPVIYKRGSTVVEILLWLLIIVPGLIYTLWRQNSVVHVCPNCDVPMISVKSRHGQRLTGA